MVKTVDAGNLKRRTDAIYVIIEEGPGRRAWLFRWSGAATSSRDDARHDGAPDTSRMLSTLEKQAC
jgi:hypothetical protein